MRWLLAAVLAALTVVAVLEGPAWAGTRPAGARVAGAPGSSARQRSNAESGLHVIPFPGTPDASPESQIIFSSLAPTDIQAVIVTGSSTGPDTGTLVALPDHAGTAFVPFHPFTSGETVSVQATLSSTHAGTASGAPDSLSLTWSFTVAVPAQTGQSGSGGTSPGTRERTANQRDVPKRAPHLRFRSEPKLQPPPVHVGAGPAPGPDDIFLTTFPGRDRGLLILNPRGQLVWFRPLRSTEIPANLEVQRYRGRSVLTWSEAIRRGRRSDVKDVIMDSSYRSVAVVRAGWGDTADLHEFQLTPQGTALVAVYVPVQTDLTSVHGKPDGSLLDSVIQEVDIRTGKVLWEWHALGHVPLTDTYAGLSATRPLDYFHINSIQQLSHQRLLVSARNTWTVYEIDERTGDIIWRLGGRSSSFDMGPGANFEWQHDAHLNAGGLLSLFNDAAAPAAESQSSAQELRLDMTTNTASLVKRFTHSPALLTPAEGSAQLLSNHDMFAGWGRIPAFSEYTPSGRQVFDATLPLGANTYRAYRFAWTGHPHTRPAVAISRSAGGTIQLYVSWNGDTQVASWRLLAGPGRTSLTPSKIELRRRFESTITVPPGRGPYFAVQALDARGRVLRRSRVLTVHGG